MIARRIFMWLTLIALAGAGYFWLDATLQCMTPGRTGTWCGFGSGLLSILSLIVGVMFASVWLILLLVRVAKSKKN
jgi:hypothetical protein